MRSHGRGWQVFIVLICMAVIISKASVQWGDAFFGFVPSKTVIQSNALYTCACTAFTCISYLHRTDTHPQLSVS